MSTILKALRRLEDEKPKKKAASTAPDVDALRDRILAEEEAARAAAQLGGRPPTDEAPPNHGRSPRERRLIALAVVAVSVALAVGAYQANLLGGLMSAGTDPSADSADSAGSAAAPDAIAADEAARRAADAIAPAARPASTARADAADPRGPAITHDDGAPGATRSPRAMVAVAAPLSSPPAEPSSERAAAPSARSHPTPEHAAAEQARLASLAAARAETAAPSAVASASAPPSSPTPPVPAPSSRAPQSPPRTAAPSQPAAAARSKVVPKAEARPEVIAEAKDRAKAQATPEAMAEAKAEATRDAKSATASRASVGSAAASPRVAVPVASLPIARNDAVVESKPSPSLSPVAAQSPPREPIALAQPEPASASASSSASSSSSSSASASASTSADPATDRSSPTRDVQRVTPVGVSDVTVLRTAWHPKAERRSARLRVGASGDVLTVHEGDAAAGLVIKEVTPSSVVFETGGIEIRRRVGESTGAPH